MQGPNVHGPFIENNFYGNRVKYTTTVLRDDKNNVIGLLCINIIIEDFQKMQNIFNLFLETKSDSTKLDELFNDNWQDRIQTFVQKFLKEKSRPLSKITREEREELVRSLYSAGAFRATNAANFIATILGISRATIYNYLNKTDNSDIKRGNAK